MRKPLVITIWLVASLTGMILILYTPHSWDCPEGASIASYNPKTSGIVVVYGDGDDIQFWDRTGQQLQRQYSVVTHTSTVTSAAFSPDSKYLLTGSVDGTAKLWDIQTSQEIQVFSNHTYNVTD